MNNNFMRQEIKERPILYSADMVNAKAAGRKTNTRRTTGLDEINKAPNEYEFIDFVVRGTELYANFLHFRTGKMLQVRSPYGKAGDHLWTRETWQYYDWTEDGLPCIRYKSDGHSLLVTDYPEEWAERLSNIWASLSEPENYNIDNHARDRKWRSSIHIPRWASRSLDEVTSVRVERLQQINNQDAKAEGIEYARPHRHGPEGLDIEITPGHVQPDPFSEFHNTGANDCWLCPFKELWQSINGPGSWARNPWVWVIGFKPCE